MLQSIKKIGEIIVGIIFIIFAVILFLKEQYGYSVLLVISLLVLLRLDQLTDFAFSFKDGLSARFGVSKEKIEENIKENNEATTPENFFRFEKVEQYILADLQKKYGGEMKTLVHFLYGQPDRPEFRYTPDGSLHTKDALYFFEIKYVLKPEFANNIVKNTLKYLNEVYTKLSPSTGGEKFIIKLILVSGYDLSYMSFEPPKGIEIEFYKI
jgi:hypothetical protein